MLQRWLAAGNSVSNWTGPRFKPQISCSREERFTAPLTGRYKVVSYHKQKQNDLENGNVLISNFNNGECTFEPTGA